MDQIAPDEVAEPLETRPTDEIDNTISLTIYINQQFEATDDLNSKQDIKRTISIDPKEIKLSQLHIQIPSKFANDQHFQSLWSDDNYEWKMYEYNNIKVGKQISNDTQLQKEITDTMKGDDDDDDDMNQEDCHVRLRVVFHKSMCIYLK